MNKKIIHTVFEDRVEKNPKNIAIVYNNQKISYEELNKEANSIANRVAKNQFIALFLPNSIDYVKSILGILKAGSIFTPIDVLAPTERIGKIINKAEIKTVITNKEYFEEIEDIIEFLKIDVEIILLEEIESNSENLALYSKEDSEAYLIFTSGSTGEPKAIVGMQKSLSHFIHWESKEFLIDESFKISQLAGVTFDVSLRDIFTALINGATLYIPTKRDDIEYLAKWISESKLNLIHIVPSLFRLLIKEFEYQKYDLTSLKHVLLAGEALYGSDVLNFHKLYPHVELVNLYGPSETTLAKIYNRVKIEDIKNPNAIIPLGKPISNSVVLILKNSKLTQIGQSGEIYIKTPFRSKGYLKDEKLTKEVFIQNPLNEKEDIIYKTGDLGKYREDGSIEFIGRVDNQVKINGIRVELNEIEIAIKSYEKIENAVIISELSPNKEVVVICYYIEKEAFSEDDIVDYLFEILPTYMIPNFFVKMETLPLNFHGKIDKKALPRPDELLYIGKEFKKPTDTIEQNIAKIFSEILNIEKVSTNVKFTELGGNSLHAISAVAKINHSLNTHITIKEFFENQTIEQLSNLVDTKSDLKEEIVIEKLPKSDSYKLSNSQRRLWVLDKMQQNFNVYNIVGVVEFDKDIDSNLLNQSLFYLIKRHEILRTNFVMIENEPRQIINQTPKSDIFEEVNTQNIDSYIENEAKRVFDLAKDALFYIKSINKNIVFINMHHIISDGWSIGIILKELSLIYTALIKKEEPILEPLEIQYKEYANWQNRLLEDEKFIQKHQEYWHNLLKEPTTLHFPLDYKRGAKQTFNGDTIHFKIDKELSKKVKELSENSTLFITLFSIINILISKYSNQDDIIVGSPVANREHKSLLNQIGFYTNTLALRSKLNRNSSFQENLEAIKEMCLEAFSHQSYPFDKLVDELGLERDVSQNPLFNIMMILQNNENVEVEFADLKSKGRDLNLKVSKFDMTFSFFEVDDELELLIEFNTNLFKSSTINRLFLNLKKLIESIEMSKKLSELSFVSDEELRELESFNNLVREYPQKTLIETFEEEVTKNPNATALIYNEKRLSYQELNTKANILGKFLRESYKIEPNKIIPIIANKSEWMIIALLGVLKSGGAYLPIDSEYPKERIEYMLSDSKASLVICDNANYSKAKSYADDLKIESFNIEELNYEDDIPNLKLINTPLDLAYLIYTSGSTGKPKGVMVENRGFVNMMSYQIEGFDVTLEDNIIQFASFSFDASVYETFLALLSGATYVVVKKEELLNNFIEITKKYNINTAVLNPTFLANIGELEGFKNIITAGERAIVSDALKYAKKCNYINAYGPSEVSICSSFYKVDPNREYNTIPIGKSIANMKNIILNQDLQEIPIGAIGEICMAGVGLARGYLNKEALTHEKFINHPKFGRIYKSGDKGRFLEDGNIEYLGRVDENQVKLRGFRIELGEIENNILSYSNIKEAVVLLKENQLIAYLIEMKKESNSLDNLKAYLNQKLPNFMIPHFFVSLESFPLTPNGKVDKKAFPSVDIPTKEIVKPQTHLEKELSLVYQDVLDVRVGIEDSFFKLGGDSIKAIQIASKLGALGYKLDVKDLFMYPTIKELTPFIKKEEQKIDQSEVIGEIPLTPIQQWFFDLDVEDKSHFNQDLLLEINTSITKEKLREITKKLLNHHDILRISYKNSIQFNNAIKDTNFSFETFEIFDTKEVKDIVQKLASSFDLRETPLIKFAFITSKEKNYLYIVAHHLIIDAVSWRILMEDLTSLFKGEKLPQKTNSFKDYSNYLLSYSKIIEDEYNFWEKSNFNFELKSDHKIDKRLNKYLTSTYFTLDEKTTKDILENINESYNTTTKDILILALNSALFKSFNLTKSVIALEHHGREEVFNLNLNRTIGWFTALYPQVLNYEDEELSKQIKLQKEALREVPYNGIGYAILKYIAHKDLNFSKEILFNYLGEFKESSSFFNFSDIDGAKNLSDDFISEFKLDISAMIVQNTLTFSIKYDFREYEKSTIEKFLENYRESLFEIIKHCLEKESSELTPDDIDDEDFDVKSLDNFLNNLEIEE